jgi:hypothetical protein
VMENFRNDYNQHGIEQGWLCQKIIITPK